jgi:hypothetical protein
MKALLFVIFSLLSHQAYSGDGRDYAARVICDRSGDDLSFCLSNVTKVFSHETLFRYSTLISGKTAHYSSWASYCKNTSTPNKCMAQFKKDYDVFLLFLLSALDNQNLELKILKCHQSTDFDSFIFTRNKQCLYK